MQNRFGQLDTGVLPMFRIIALDIIITLRFSINCSAVICSPTIIISISREASSETYSHQVYFPSQQFLIYYFAIFYFQIYIIKIPKIFILLLLSLSDLTLASSREGIDNPFIALVARFLFVCVGTRDLRVAFYWIDTLVLKN